MHNPIASGIRPPGAAGFFYPSSPQKLSRLVHSYLEGERREDGRTIGSKVTDKESDAPIALVVPHAGYDYSGGVAGEAYSTLKGYNFSAVIIVAPSHLEPFPGVSLFPGTAYRTPLGDCPVESELAKILIAESKGKIQPALRGHWLEGQQRQEHSLEVQLPFLQVLSRKDPSIVPLVVGDQSWQTIEELGLTMADAIRNYRSTDRVLMVASSDLSHFHGDTHAEKLDNRALKLMEAFQPRAFYEELQRGKIEACGGGPIAAVMVAARELGASRATILSYTHSGRFLGDHRSVVGYGAVRFD